MTVLASTNHLSAFFKIELVTWLDVPILADSTATFTFCALSTIPELSVLNGSHVSKIYSEKNAFTFLMTSSMPTCTGTKSERR